MNLASRHRPQQLHQVCGQKTITNSINGILNRAAKPKAWLLIGPSGTGKTTLARIIANIIVNNNTAPISAPNITEIDAAVNTGAEDMREVTIKAQYRAIGSSPIKVFVIDEAHNLSGKAFDALLKSTEEPPEHVYWILCTTNPTKIPDTLKTRCVKFTLKPVSEAEIFELLLTISEKEKFKVLPEVLELIAEGSGGSPRQAITNLETCADAKTLGEARELLRTAAQLKGPVDIAKFLLSGRGQFIDAIKIINSIENVEAETVRIVITNYIAGALMKSKSNNEAQRILYMLECFGSPYNSSDKLAPLLLSIGAAMGIGQ